MVRQAANALVKGESRVSPTGVEPVTFGSGGQRSIQLSYGDNCAGILNRCRRVDKWRPCAREPGEPLPRVPDGAPGQTLADTPGEPCSLVELFTPREPIITVESAATACNDPDRL